MRHHLLKFLLMLCLVTQFVYLPDLMARHPNKFIDYIKHARTSKLGHALESEKSKYQEYRSLYLNAPDEESGQTPLVYAIDHGMLISAKYLVEANADVNIQDGEGMSALMLAAIRDQDELVENLLNHGAKHDLKNKEGETAYSLAESHNAKDVIALFTQKGLTLKKELPKEQVVAHGETGAYRPDLDHDATLVKFTPDMDGFDIYSNLHVQTMTFENTQLPVYRAYPSNKGLVSYGAEKEGFSSHIVNVATPTVEVLKSYVNALGHSDRKEFLQDLLSGLQKGDYRETEVKDMNGRVYTIGYSYLLPASLNFENLKTGDLESLFKKWMDQTADHPFTFLKKDVRRHIFLGYMPDGTSYSTSRAHIAEKYLGYHHLKYIKDNKRRRESTYLWDWHPHFGISERFISRIVNAAEFKPHVYVGWEINSNIIRSPGDYEMFLEWMRQSFPNDPTDDVCTAPGHQRMVFPDYKGLCVAKEKEIHHKIMEFFRHVQTYVLLKATANNTGILQGKWQQALFDHEFTDEDMSHKGLIRKEYGRWDDNTGAIEIRSGVKNPESQRMIQKSLAARISSSDWDDMEMISSWQMIPDYLTSSRIHSSGTIDDMAKRFGVTYGDMSSAVNAIVNSRVVVPNWDWTGCYSGYRHNYMSLFPFWYWENAPYLGQFKREMIKNLTKDLIYYLGHIGGDYWKVRRALAAWSKTSNLALNIMDYLRPTKKWTNNYPSPELYVYAPATRINVDVNKIDLGIEYTARYPLASNFTKESGVNLTKNIDLTDTERKQLFLAFSKALAKNLGYGDVPVKDKSQKNIHGHGIDLTMGFNNPKNSEQGWKVEWDGIFRMYGNDGQRIEGMQGGGHLEVVTPKFVPTYRDMQAVYKTYKDFGMVPIVTAGAAHINIDLAPFERNPHALGRFLGTFYNHRGIISAMFQNVNRLRTAEPLIIPNEMQRQLADFRGSEGKLKQLLYNYGHYNNRMGRKTRYVQLDVGSYFQDVIPSKFITDDFDIINPTVPWRPQFRVSPNVRKMEFRLFDAPKSAYEAALQVKLVRGLLNKAFNSTASIAPEAQYVRHAYYFANAKVAFSDLKRMTDDLGLSFQEYKGFLGESLSKDQIIIRKKTFKPFEVRMKKYPILPKANWGVAVPERSMSEAIDSKGRSYDPADFAGIAELNAFNQGRVQALQEANATRAKQLDKLSTYHAFKRDFSK